jgi:nucleoside triphosphatase
MDEKTYPEVTVGVLVFNKEGKIFLMVSPKWHGKYGMAGGHIEYGEKIEETAKREIKEETGLEIFDIEFLMVQECIFSEAFWKKKHFVFLDYIAKAKDEKVILDGREGTEYVWATIDEALELPLNPYTRNTILEYKKKYKK